MSTVKVRRSRAPQPLGAARQTIEGWGSMYRHYTHPDFFNVGPGGTGGSGMPIPTVSAAQRNAWIDLLYTTGGLGLTRMRVCDPTTDRAASGVNVFNVEPVNGAGFTFSGPRVDDYAAWVVDAKDRGDLDTFWWSPAFRESWMGPGDGWGNGGLNPAVVPADVADYGDWCVAILDRFRDLGAQPDVICTGNEPSYPAGANRMSKAYVRDIIKNLGPRLEAAGLLKPWVLGDDNTLAYENALIDVVMADPVAAAYITRFATHLYDGPLANAAGLVTRGGTYGKPLWMSEFSKGPMNTITDWPGSNTDIDYAWLMHELLVTYGFTAIDYMMGVFGVGEGSTLAEVTYAGGAITGTAVRRVGYYFGQFSKYVRPGDVRVDAASSNGSAKVSAYWRSPSGLAVVAVNPTGSPATTTISAADLAGRTSMSVVRSSPSENWAGLADQAVSAGAMTVTLPGPSVTTFVGAA